MSKLSKSADRAQIGAFIVGVIMLALMVWPLLSPQPAPQTAVVVTGWIAPIILAACVLLAAALHFAAAYIRRDRDHGSTSPKTEAGRIFIMEARAIAWGLIDELKQDRISENEAEEKVKTWEQRTASGLARHFDEAHRLRFLISFSSDGAQISRDMTLPHPSNQRPLWMLLYRISVRLRVLEGFAHDT